MQLCEKLLAAEADCAASAYLECATVKQLSYRRFHISREK